MLDPNGTYHSREIGLDTGAVPPTEFVGYTQPEAEAEIGMLLDDQEPDLSDAICAAFNLE